MRAVLAEGLAPMSVKSGTKVISQSPYFSVNPDLVFDYGTVTGDVKYKTAGHEWVRNDVSQAALFASGYKASAAVITTFAKSLDVVDLEMRLGDMHLKRFVWCAVEGLDPAQVESDFVARVGDFVMGYVGLLDVA